MLAAFFSNSAVISTTWVPAATLLATFTFAVVPPYSFRYRSMGGRQHRHRA